MNQNRFGQLQLNFSGIGCWLTLFAFIWLFGVVGLGWIIKSALIFIVLLMLVPVVAFIGIRIWLNRNLIEGDCPVCGQSLTGLKGWSLGCPSCTTPLQVTAEGFQRSTPEGTIEVDAVDVEVTSVADDPADDTVIDVEVRPLPSGDD